MSPPVSTKQSGAAAASRSAGFASVTELPGSGATPEQLSMLYTRYQWASTFCAGRAVLEVACGPGLGLGLLAGSAHRMVGGDYDLTLLQKARAHYEQRAALVQLDAQALPFQGQVFDVVILFEAVYYLPRPQDFLHEVRRVLRPGGTVLICSANRDWPGFYPSAKSHQYPSAADLWTWLGAAGFSPQVHAAFPATARSRRQRVVSVLRWLAVRSRLIPGTMRARERLKRVIYGPLVPLPAEVQEGVAVAVPLVPVLAPRAVPEFKVVYAVGRLP